MKSTLKESLGLDLPTMAKIIKKKGRGRDTILAHITPEEAKLLKKRGGRGSINPETGLLEFEDVAPESTYTPTDTSIGPSYSAPATDTTPVSTPVTDSVSAAPSTDYGYTGVQLPQYQTQAPGEYATDIGVTPQTPGVGVQLPVGAGTPGADLAAQAQQLEDTTQAPTTAAKPGVLDKLTGALGNLSGADLTRLGLAGGLGLTGYLQNKNAQKQIQNMQGQEQAIAAPYQQTGQNLMAQASRGELSPASLQAYQAAQAQINQGIASRGGVGEQQAANQLSAIYQTLLNNQFNYGLQVSQIGDQIALGAIQTGMQLDQQLQTQSQNFYGQLAALAAGVPVQQKTTAI